MRLYSYPPETDFIGQTDLADFATCREWRSYLALPSTHVLVNELPAGGDGDRPQWSLEAKRTLSPIYFFSVTDVFYFPWSSVLVSSDGGVFRIPLAETASMGNDFSFLPFCKNENGTTTFHPPRDLPFIEDLALTIPFGGGSGGNYGHFLLDGLPTACSFEEAGLLDDRILAIPELRPWQLRHLELLKLHPKVHKEYVYRVRRAIYSSAMDHNLLRPNLNYRTLRERGLASSRRKIGPRFDRVYLSRGGIQTRLNETEAELQQRLVARGFTVIEPSALDVDEQIELFSNADIIVGCTGAAFANALYARQDATIIEIQPTGMYYSWVQDVCAIVNCGYAPYFVQGIVTDARGAHVGSRFAVEVDAFVEWLRQVVPKL